MLDVRVSETPEIETILKKINFGNFPIIKTEMNVQTQLSRKTVSSNAKQIGKNNNKIIIYFYPDRVIPVNQSIKIIRRV